MADIAKFAGATVGELDAKLKDVRIPRANLGPCPVCGHDIIENRKGYSCWSREDPGCGFVIWKAQGRQAAARRRRQGAHRDRPHGEGRSPASRAAAAARSAPSLALVQNEEGKWRVEFDEPWAKEGAKPPEVDEAEAAAAAVRRARRLAAAALTPLHAGVSGRRRFLRPSVVCRSP